ncbi:hypothetical protein MMC17_009089 [Xylographa soralifera]|nr:hypothetical protein [Xylographa soralifera]
MKSSHLLLSCLLFATNLLAASHGLQRRGSGLMTSGQAPDNTEELGSANWAGAILDAPAGQAYNYVYGVFTVPNASPPPGSGDGSWGSAAWVGLGGVHSEPLIQAAIASTVNSTNGITMQSFGAFYEWIPAGAASVDMEISAGDEIALTVISNSDGSAGTITIDNQSSGQIFSTAITMPVPDSNIKGDSAEWIVEDYMVGTGFEPLADFGTVTFTDCGAMVGSESFGIQDATVVIMMTDVIEANTSILDSSTVQVTYLVDGPSI